MIASAWLKWARAVEHQRMLARVMREYIAADPYEYKRFDNHGDGSDPLLRMYWRLGIRRPYPQQWSVLHGDVVANLRGELDHAMWTAVEVHSGPPAKPAQVQFPIATDAAKFGRTAAQLQPLVAADVWDMIERLQPFHGGTDAHGTVGGAAMAVQRGQAPVSAHGRFHRDRLRPNLG